MSKTDETKILHCKGWREANIFLHGPAGPDQDNLTKLKCVRIIFYDKKIFALKINFISAIKHSTNIGTFVFGVFIKTGHFDNPVLYRRISL